MCLLCSGSIANPHMTEKEPCPFVILDGDINECSLTPKMPSQAPVSTHSPSDVPASINVFMGCPSCNQITRIPMQEGHQNIDAAGCHGLQLRSSQECSVFLTWAARDWPTHRERDSHAATHRGRIEQTQRLASVEGNRERALVRLGVHQTVFLVSYQVMCPRAALVKARQGYRVVGWAQHWPLQRR